MPGSKRLTITHSEFRALNKSLIKFFRRLNEPDAEDLAASTWVDITRYYQGRCSLRYYAFRVARTKASQERRTRHRRLTDVHPVLDPESEDIDYSSALGGPSPDSVLMLAFGHEVLTRALEGVHQPYREAVSLWLEGCVASEIAGRLGVEYNTARSRLQRGRSQLTAALKQEYPG